MQIYKLPTTHNMITSTFNPHTTLKVHKSEHNVTTTTTSSDIMAPGTYQNSTPEGILFKTYRIYVLPQNDIVLPQNTKSLPQK